MTTRTLAHSAHQPLYHTSYKSMPFPEKLKNNETASMIPACCFCFAAPFSSIITTIKSCGKRSLLAYSANQTAQAKNDPLNVFLDLTGHNRQNGGREFRKVSFSYTILIEVYYFV